MTRGLGRALLVLATTCTAMLAMGGLAHAASTYFVSPAGSNGDCLSPATACLSLGGAIGIATDGDTINVAPGTYTEFVTVTENDLTITGADPATTIIDSSGPDALYVNGSGDGASLNVSGLTLRAPLAGGNRALSLDNGASITADRLVLRGGSVAGSAVQLGAGGVNSLDMDGSGFVGAGSAVQDLAVISFGASNNITVSGSILDGYQTVLHAAGGTTKLLGNQISGLHDLVNGTPTAGISISGGAATLEGNTITQAGAGDPNGVGIQVQGGTLSMARNKIIGLTNRTAVSVAAPTTTATLFSDVLTGNSAGLVTSGGGLAVALTNVTIAGNTERNVSASSTTLGLDSTLIGDAGTLPDIFNGGTLCTGSDSRVPAGSPWDSCTGGALTSAAPLLGGPGGWHLQPGSPLIDAGGPALVDPGQQTDADGQARHIAGPLALAAGCAAPTRDIGADEFTPGRDCSPPVTPPVVTPPVVNPRAAVKCKRPRKKTKKALKKFKKCKKRAKRR
jgi:hypothetical protein